VPLTEKEVTKFATFAVNAAAVPSYHASDERKGKLLLESQLAALSFYDQIQSDIRESGYRITQRVQNIIWKTLKEIEAKAKNP
jgi:hypothetical protein